MTANQSDKIFAGSIPEFYETYLVPLIFEPYARDLASRVASERTGRVLEIAAGTGVVTRAMVDALDTSVSIVATDLNQAMLDYGASVRTDENVTWQQADALVLPFDDASFDTVVCQFSVMFFPSRVRAYAEVLRVLTPGGRFIFNVWDHIRENEFADTVTDSLASLFQSDPPLFLARTPHGYSNVEKIATDLKNGGFSANPQVETMAALSIAAKPSIPAIAYCQGTPLRNEIESRNGHVLAEATDVATEALSDRFGSGAIDGKIQGHIFSIRA
jgi:SAM-dependent methyltransferase